MRVTRAISVGESEDSKGGSRQPGKYGADELQEEAQGPTLPYPTFSLRQSAILFLRLWHTPPTVNHHRLRGTSHGDDDVIRCSCQIRSRGNLETPLILIQ